MSADHRSAVNELHALVAARAADDAEFRDALLRDPREAISRELGIELPAATKIGAALTAAGALVLTLPPDLEASVAQAPATDLECCDCCCC